MTAATKEAQRKTAHPKLFVEGEPVICTSSNSPGYTVGKQYTPYKNELGHLSIDADDGFTDLCTLLVSSFKKD